VSIALLGSFALVVRGIQLASVNLGSQRLLALLGMHRRSHTRASVAATLWPEASAEHASECLRSALARLEVPRTEVIRADASGLQLVDSVDVDFTRARAIAIALLARSGNPVAGDLSQKTVALFADDLLPDWVDDWVTTEADDWRQLRLSALDTIAARLLAQGRLREAGVAARAAIRIDPLRESAQCALVMIYLAKGNQSDAIRAVKNYSLLLDEELGIGPTEQLLTLVSGLQHVTT
jgi:DNA-binding SARP family transcriptional activator